MRSIADQHNADDTANDGKNSKPNHHHAGTMDPHDDEIFVCVNATESSQPAEAPAALVLHRCETREHSRDKRLVFLRVQACVLLLGNSVGITRQLLIATAMLKWNLH